MKRVLSIVAGSVFAMNAMVGCSADRINESVDIEPVAATAPSTTLSDGIRLSSTFEVTCDPSRSEADQIVRTVEEGHGAELGDVPGDATRAELAQLACINFGLEYPDVERPVRILASFACKFADTTPCSFGLASSVGVDLLTPQL